MACLSECSNCGTGIINRHKCLVCGDEKFLAIQIENDKLKEENELLKQLCDQMDSGARDRRFRKKS